MRLTLVQMNSRTAARDENVERACAFIDQAAEAGSDLVVLPEFFNNEWISGHKGEKLTITLSVALRRRSFRKEPWTSDDTAAHA
jgi:predicted amidohydrolase